MDKKDMDKRYYYAYSTSYVRPTYAYSSYYVRPTYAYRGNWGKRVAREETEPTTRDYF